MWILVSPIVSRSLQLVAGSQNMNTQVTGVYPQYQSIRNLEVTDGSFFSEYEYQMGARVVVIGSTVASTLFPDSDPVGQTDTDGQ